MTSINSRLPFGSSRGYVVEKTVEISVKWIRRLMSGESGIHCPSDELKSELSIALAAQMRVRASMT